MIMRQSLLFRQPLVEQMFHKGLIVFFIRMCYTNIKYAQRIKNMIIWLLTGLWVLLGCAEAAHLITIMTNRSLQTYTVLCGVLSLAGLFAYIGIFIWWYRRHKKSHTYSYKDFFSPAIWLFVALTGVTIYRLFGGYVPDLQDAVYEIVIGNLDSGSIMTEHPFLGGTTEAVVPMRFRILGLSSLYSALITFSQQSQYMIMCKMVPLGVWFFSILIYWMFAEEIFGEDAHKKWLFVSLAAFVYLATSGKEGLPGYRLFFAGFSGETIRALLLMPYTLYVCWRKKWMLAVIAMLAEACLVWTTYGVGYCVLITVCMYGVHLLADRRAKHAA